MTDSHALNCNCAEVTRCEIVTVLSYQLMEYYLEIAVVIRIMNVDLCC